MKIIFTAWIMINGAWTHGSHVDGWYPVNTGSEAACEKGLENAAKLTNKELMFTCETVESTARYLLSLEL